MFLVPDHDPRAAAPRDVRERLRDYPFRIEVASRFRSAAEVRAAVKDFTDGKVDVLIGTPQAALSRRSARRTWAS
jgi:transcription-repair coupling factor (superfamily II helicase)